jgi:hypothetical protein
LQQKEKLDVHYSVIEAAKMHAQVVARRAAEEDFAGAEPAETVPSNAVPSGMVGHH